MYPVRVSIKDKEAETSDLCITNSKNKTSMNISDTSIQFTLTVNLENYTTKLPSSTAMDIKLQNSQMLRTTTPTLSTVSYEMNEENQTQVDVNKFESSLTTYITKHTANENNNMSNTITVKSQKENLKTKIEENIEKTLPVGENKTLLTNETTDLSITNSENKTSMNISDTPIQFTLTVNLENYTTELPSSTEMNIKPTTPTLSTVLYEMNVENQTQVDVNKFKSSLATYITKHTANENNNMSNTRTVKSQKKNLKTKIEENIEKTLPVDENLAGKTLLTNEKSDLYITNSKNKTSMNISDTPIQFTLTVYFENYTTELPSSSAMDIKLQNSQMLRTTTASLSTVLYEMNEENQTQMNVNKFESSLTTYTTKHTANKNKNMSNTRTVKSQKENLKSKIEENIEKTLPVGKNSAEKTLLTNETTDLSITRNENITRINLSITPFQFTKSIDLENNTNVFLQFRETNKKNKNKLMLQMTTPTFSTTSHMKKEENERQMDEHKFKPSFTTPITTNTENNRIKKYTEYKNIKTPNSIKRESPEQTVKLKIMEKIGNNLTARDNIRSFLTEKTLLSNQTTTFFINKIITLLVIPTMYPVRVSVKDKEAEQYNLDKSGLRTTENNEVVSLSSKITTKLRNLTLNEVAQSSFVPDDIEHTQNRLLSSSRDNTSSVKTILFRTQSLITTPAISVFDNSGVLKPINEVNKLDSVITTQLPTAKYVSIQAVTKRKGEKTNSDKLIITTPPPARIKNYETAAPLATASVNLKDNNVQNSTLASIKTLKTKVNNYTRLMAKTFIPLSELLTVPTELTHHFLLTTSIPILKTSKSLIHEFSIKLNKDSLSNKSRADFFANNSISHKINDQAGTSVIKPTYIKHTTPIVEVMVTQVNNNLNKSIISPSRNSITKQNSLQKTKNKHININIIKKLGNKNQLMPTTIFPKQTSEKNNTYSFVNETEIHNTTINKTRMNFSITPIQYTLFVDLENSTTAGPSPRVVDTKLQKVHMLHMATTTLPTAPYKIDVEDQRQTVVNFEPLLTTVFENLTDIKTENTLMTNQTVYLFMPKDHYNTSKFQNKLQTLLKTYISTNIDIQKSMLLNKTTDTITKKTVKQEIFTNTSILNISKNTARESVKNKSTGKYRINMTENDKIKIKFENDKDEYEITTAITPDRIVKSQNINLTQEEKLYTSLNKQANLGNLGKFSHFKNNHQVTTKMIPLLTEENEVQQRIFLNTDTLKTFSSIFVSSKVIPNQARPVFTTSMNSKYGKTVISTAFTQLTMPIKPNKLVYTLEKDMKLESTPISHQVAAIPLKTNKSERMQLLGAHRFTTSYSIYIPPKIKTRNKETSFSTTGNEQRNIRVSTQNITIPNVTHKSQLYEFKPTSSTLYIVNKARLTNTVNTHKVEIMSNKSDNSKIDIVKSENFYSTNHIEKRFETSSVHTTPKKMTKYFSTKIFSSPLVTPIIFTPHEHFKTRTKNTSESIIDSINSQRSLAQSKSSGISTKIITELTVNVPQQKKRNTTFSKLHKFKTTIFPTIQQNKSIFKSIETSTRKLNNLTKNIRQNITAMKKGDHIQTESKFIFKTKELSSTTPQVTNFSFTPHNIKVLLDIKNNFTEQKTSTKQSNTTNSTKLLTIITPLTEKIVTSSHRGPQSYLSLIKFHQNLNLNTSITAIFKNFIGYNHTCNKENKNIIKSQYRNRNKIVNYGKIDKYNQQLNEKNTRTFTVTPIILTKPTTRLMRKSKTTKYKTYEPIEDDRERTISPHIISNYKLVKSRHYNILMTPRSQNKLRKTSHILEKKNDIFHHITNDRVKNNKESKIKIQKTNFIKNGNEEIMPSFEKTNLYPLMKFPSKAHGKGIKRISKPNKQKEMIAMNPRGFFTQRQLTTRPKVREPTQRPPINHRVQNIATVKSKHYVIRPMFDKVDGLVKLSREHVKPKPLFFNNNDDFYRKDFINHHHSEALSLREKVNYIKETFNHNVPAKNQQQVIDRPIYLPPINTKPKLLRDRIDSIRNYLYNAEFIKPSQMPIKKVVESTTKDDEPYRDPFYYYRRSGWYEDNFEGRMPTTTTTRKPTKRQRRTIFFLSPTIPYNYYF